MGVVRAEDRRSGDQVAEHAVVVAGGGPTGLMLAGELALADHAHHLATAKDRHAELLDPGGEDGLELVAEVEMNEEPELGFRRDSVGQHALGRRQAGEPVRVVLTERTVDHTGGPDLEELRAAIFGVYGTDFGLRSASWISQFTDMARQAASYRSGRVLLAGDAAHVHPPQGGQGLNTGVQDAVNLGWKLAQVLRGTTPDSLLDTYHDERHPVGARVLHNTMAQVALASPDDRHQALRDTMGELLGMDEPRRRLAGMLSGLDIHDDLGEGHPLLGRRVPDLDLRTAGGLTRVYALLHDARARYSSTSPSPVSSTSPPGRIEYGSSTPSTRTGGSSRSSARSPPRQC